MKQTQLFITALLMVLTMAGLSGCSSDDVTGKGMKTGEMVQMFDNLYAPYKPIQADKAPVWLQNVMASKDDITYMYYVVFRGNSEEGVVYNVHTLTDSTAFGHFMNENGEYLPITMKYFEDATGWECIYYRNAT